MAAKNPKSTEKIVLNKIPRTIVSPASYKELPVSWQVGFIDNGSRWGISSLKDQFVFHDNELSTSMKNIHEDLRYSLIAADKREEESLGEIMQNIIDQAKGNISANHMPSIMKNIIGTNVFITKIYPKLKHYEESCWEEIEKEQYGRGKTKHHSVDVSKIVSEAKKRLIELKLDDIDQLFSIRLEGKIRIWGIRHYSFLRILWIDLKHEICPTDKD